MGNGRIPISQWHRNGIEWPGNVETDGQDLVIDCGTAKTMRLEEAVWDDLVFEGGVWVFAGSADPTLSPWQPGGSGTTFQVYKFKKDDCAYIVNKQMPHRYKEGSDMYVHLHWSPGDRGNEESAKKVGWKIDLSIADIHSAFPASTTYDLSDTCTGTDDYHEITASATISGTGLSVSHCMVAKIYRSDTGTDDTWVSTNAAESPILLSCDIHYQVDTMGSRQQLTK